MKLKTTTKKLLMALLAIAVLSNCRKPDTNTAPETLTLYVTPQSGLKARALPDAKSEVRKVYKFQDAIIVEKTPVKAEEIGGVQGNWLVVHDQQPQKSYVFDGFLSDSIPEGPVFVGNKYDLSENVPYNLSSNNCCKSTFTLYKNRTFAGKVLLPSEECQCEKVKGNWHYAGEKICFDATSMIFECYEPGNELLERMKKEVAETTECLLDGEKFPQDFKGGEFGAAKSQFYAFLGGNKLMMADLAITSGAGSVRGMGNWKITAGAVSANLHANFNLESTLKFVCADGDQIDNNCMQQATAALQEKAEAAKKNKNSLDLSFNMNMQRHDKSAYTFTFGNFVVKETPKSDTVLWSKSRQIKIASGCAFTVTQ